MLKPDELASLDFIADELLLEHDVARTRDLALHLYMHAFHEHDLAPYVKRLLAFTSSDYMTVRRVSQGLAVHAYDANDAALVETLLASPRAIHVLQVDHRRPVGAGPIASIIAFADMAVPAEKQLAFKALENLARFGADLGPALDLLFGALGTKPSGRGLKKVDLDAYARGALSTLDRARLRAELERRAPTSAGARAYLGTLKA